MVNIIIVDTQGIVYIMVSFVPRFDLIFISKLESHAELELNDSFAKSEGSPHNFLGCVADKFYDI